MSVDIIMIKTFEARLQEAVSSMVDRSPASASKAAAIVLNEDFSTGSDVVVLDDPTYPYAGLKGKVKGPSANKGAGYLDVEFPNGNVVPLQASLLSKV